MTSCNNPFPAFGGSDVYRVSFYPWLSCLYLIGILSLLLLRLIYEWKNSLADLAFIATGLPFSLIWRRRSRRQGES